MNEQEIKNLYSEIKSLYGLKYRTTEPIYEETTETHYDHMSMYLERSTTLVGEKEVIRTIKKNNVIDAIDEIITGKAHLI